MYFLYSKACVLLLFQFFSLTQGLINLDWQTLHDEVTIRYFSPDLFYQSQDPEEIWNYMGRNISCSVQVELSIYKKAKVTMEILKDDMSVNVEVPEEFHSDLPFNIYAHGFISSGEENAPFVEGFLMNHELRIIKSV